MLEIVDANVVALLAIPLRQVANPLATFDTASLQKFLRKPLDVSQSLILDNSGAGMPAINIESMRSQKTVTFSAIRIDVHDRSGESARLNKSELADTLLSVLDALEVDEVKEIGANCVFSYALQNTDSPIAEIIADKVFRPDLSIWPNSTSLVGGSCRFFLTDSDGIGYTITIEPRNLTSDSTEVVLSCNTHRLVSGLPTRGELNTIFQESHKSLLHVAQEIFPGVKL